MTNIGKIQSRLSGSTAVSSNVNAGDTLNLERESGNPNDRNAIRAMTGNEKIAYLICSDAIWLTPLMDRGLLDIKTTIICRCALAGIPIELSIKATGSGDGILNPNREGGNQGTAHNSLLNVYFNLETYSLEKTLKEILRIHSNITSGQQLLPESTLIFRVIIKRVLELEDELESVSITDHRLLHVSPYKTIR